MHYLGEQIKQTLGNGNKFGVKIKYSEEPNLLNYIYNACNKWQEPELIMLKELILEIEPTILAPTNS